MKRTVYFLTALLWSVTLRGQPMFFEEPEIFKITCEGNLEKLNTLLQDNSGLDHPSGITLLHKAVACQQKEIMAFLLKEGFDINAKDNIGRTPLFIAIEVQNQDIIDLLKQKKAQVNFDIMYQDGLRPLEKAILFGGLPAVKFFVENGAPLDDMNLRGSTPLRIAQRDGLKDIAEYLISNGANQSLAQHPPLVGEYLGQKTPGLTPKMFASGIVSIEHGNINVSFHPNRREIYFTIESPTYNRGTIMVTKMDGDVWTKPEPLKAIGDFTSWEPFVSSDGKKLFFVSKRPVSPGGPRCETMDIWVLDRKENDWSDPVYLGDMINTKEDELHPTVAQNGNLYYSNKGIQMAEFKDEEFQPSIPWMDPGDTLNWNADPFIAPDESYLMFTSYRPGGFGEGDIYISFRNEDGSWNPSKNMGSTINSFANEFPAGLTPDGKYFLFASSKEGFFMPDIYWVDAKVIEELR